MLEGPSPKCGFAGDMAGEDGGRARGENRVEVSFVTVSVDGCCCCEGG